MAPSMERSECREYGRLGAAAAGLPVAVELLIGEGHIEA
jgi:hypothetical protein